MELVVMEPRWCVPGGEGDALLIPILESFLVVEGNLLLLALCAAQHVHLLCVGVGRKATGRGDGLEERHAGSHRQGSDVLHFSDEIDMLTVNGSNRDGHERIVDVFFEARGEVCAEQHGRKAGGGNIADEGKGDHAVGADGERTGEARLLPDGD